MTVTSTLGDGGINLAKALATIENKVGKVGWIEGNRYEDREGESGMYVAQVAAIQEFGYPSMHIPPRPFIFPTIAKQRSNWAKLGEDGLRAVFEGRTNIDFVMDSIGKRAAGDIKQAISVLTTPPLSPRTIAARIERSGLSTSKKSNLTGKLLKPGGINNLNSTELKTVGSLTKPLIDTGIMFKSCINSVENA